MSLRVKFIVALLATSLLSMVLVWAVAHQRLLSRFDDLLLARAARNFRGDVTAYWLTYGSWEAGQHAEPFPHFVARRKALLAQSPRPEALEGGPPRPAQDTGDTDDAQALPPWQGAPTGLGMLQAGVPPRGRAGSPPDDFRPPFRFLLLDPDGRVLNPVDPRDAAGRTAKPEERARAVPIAVAGAVVAYASPLGTINYSDTDRAYLTAVRDALAWGIGAAAVMAVGLGLLLGNRLSRSLRALTRAIAGMQDGRLRQRVAITSHDEVGVLAQTFNSMSDELARSHEALQASHRTISEQAEQLRDMALHDSLTQLSNRRHFDAVTQQLYEQSVRYDRPLSVMIGDIDFFKRINDGFSHATGDVVLQAIGGLFLAHTRASDVVARYGGEEFVIAFPETELSVAAEFCERLRQRIQDHPWHAIHPELRVTMSMGLCGDVALGGVEAMLKAADALLYEAKSAGRNRVCYRPAERAA